MIVEFSIYPMDDTHISAELQEVTLILESLGLEYQVGPIGTCVKGEWEEVLQAIEKCHKTMMSNHERVITSITIDDRKKSEHSLIGAVEAVEKVKDDEFEDDEDHKVLAIQRG
jgi:uncharacterized protein (TIGR00106 family)